MGEAARGAQFVSLEALAREGFGPHAETLGLVGVSPAIRALGARVASAARSAATVLIQGETGTGKELIARALHALGPRAGAPFLAHNFGAISDSLVESELFGHVRGAFTGAHADRAGLFEIADGGTLFLDEIGDASAVVQSRLLRALQEGEVRRVGEGRSRTIDVRVVAATHRDLLAESHAGRFRADLYYRLHVLSVRAPSLRERRGDIPLLLAHALGRLRRRDGAGAEAIEEEALGLLLEHDWPGNVRELLSVVERATVSVRGQRVFTVAAVAEALGPAQKERARYANGSLRAMRHDFEREAILMALERHGGNRTRAARALGLTRQGLWKKIRRIESGSPCDGSEASPLAPDSP